jgi:hypothetical protein
MAAVTGPNHCLRALTHDEARKIVVRCAGRHHQSAKVLSQFNVRFQGIVLQNYFGP